MRRCCSHWPHPCSTFPWHCSFCYLLIATANARSMYREAQDPLTDPAKCGSAARRRLSAVGGGEALPAQRDFGWELCWAWLISHEPAQRLCRSRPQPGLCCNRVHGAGTSALVRWNVLQEIIRCSQGKRIAWGRQRATQGCETGQKLFTA